MHCYGSPCPNKLGWCALTKSLSSFAFALLLRAELAQDAGVHVWYSFQFQFQKSLLEKVISLLSVVLK